ncbi:MAG: MtrB/PioB family outer membrane beta-barrel protein [Candidatus Aminicenantales bacterium]
MRRKKVLLPIVVFGFVFSLAFSLLAEEEESPFYGRFLFGYRFVDTSGTIEKYKEDINLEEGVRLFSFSLHYVPKEKLKALFDRIDLNLYNLGGDPFETFSLSVQKYGKYRFQYDRRKSTYFYADQHRVGFGQLYDHHTFDFERTADSGYLKVWLGNKASIYMNFDRFTKKGESITTFDINRIEFEFDKPISEDMKQVAGGINVNLNRYALVYEVKFQDYDNSNSLFLPGFADGGPGARYPSSLNFFTLNQPYDLQTETHTFKFNARPLNSLLISGSAVYSNQKMDLTYSEESDGINYLGRFFTYSSSGDGRFDRKIQLYDFDLTYLLFDKLAIIGAVRYHNFDQDSRFSSDSRKELSEIGYDTLGIEAGLQFQPSSKMALSLGYRYEERDLAGVETVTYEEKTKRNGLFGNLKLTPAKAFRLTVDYQYGSYEDPFTLISPTSFNRFKAAANIQARNLQLSGSYLWQKSESVIFEETVWEEKTWESTKNVLSLRAGYHTEKVRASAGYSLIDIQHKGDRIIAYPPAWSGAGTFPWEILYEGKSYLLDGLLHLNLFENWSAGGYANSYNNSGFWEISRFMFKGYVEYTFTNGLVSQLGYRYVDFKEESSGFNDYKANIFELSFGYRWK